MTYLNFIHSSWSGTTASADGLDDVAVNNGSNLKSDLHPSKGCPHRQMKESREDSFFYVHHSSRSLVSRLGLNEAAIVANSQRYPPCLQFTCFWPVTEIDFQSLEKNPSLRTATSRDTYLWKKSCYSTYLTKIEEMTHQNSGKDKNAPLDDSWCQPTCN